MKAGSLEGACSGKRTTKLRNSAWNIPLEAVGDQCNASAVGYSFVPFYAHAYRRPFKSGRIVFFLRCGPARSPQICQQFQSGLIPVSRLLLEALQDDLF